MHKINVLAYGPKNFNISLEELKEYLNFNLTTSERKINTKLLNNFDILFFHQDYFKEYNTIELLDSINQIKILAFHSKNISLEIFNYTISLPTKLEDLNNVIQNSVAKKNFSKNSSIQIKDYILDKNVKKLSKDNKYILLTEKEIQLIELFLNNNKAISKNQILKKVWKYASEADTHTVETHIYRLRKKVKSEFSDENFILNNKSGYLF
jgi:hypothetical protein